MFLAGLLGVLCQRVNLPIGGPGLPLSAAIMFGATGYLILSQKWRIGGVGMLLYLLLTLAGGVSFLVNAASAYEPTATSLLYFVAVYGVVVLLPADPARRVNAGYHYIGGVLVACVIGAALSVLQAVGQWASIGFIDPISRLPASLQVAGFNAQYRTTWLATTLGQEIKPNGMIFLEPSFLSIFAAFGVVLLAQRMVTGTSGPKDALAIMVLVFGLAISISTSGLPVLALGLVPLLPRLLNSLRALVLFAVVLALATGTGLLGGIIAKSTEGFGGNTSSGLRLVVPYQVLPPYWEQSPAFGNGPGSMSTITQVLGVSNLQPPSILKIAVEYGAVGFTLWALILAVAVLNSRAPMSIRLATLAIYLIPGEAILNAAVVGLVFIGTAHWNRDGMNPDPTSSEEPLARIESSAGAKCR